MYVEVEVPAIGPPRDMCPNVCSIVHITMGERAYEITSRERERFLTLTSYKIAFRDETPMLLKLETSVYVRDSLQLLTG
jgi:hypothetical protein